MKEEKWDFLAGGRMLNWKVGLYCCARASVGFICAWESRCIRALCCFESGRALVSDRIFVIKGKGFIRSILQLGFFYFCFNFLFLVWISVDYFIYINKLYFRL